MRFFFPLPSGQDGGEPAERAEEPWQACRKGAEDDLGRENALARRVYWLRFIHNGKTHEVRVGEDDPYENQKVMAIIAFPGVYTIRCFVRGFLKIGDPILVGEGDVLDVEDFEL